MDWTQFMPLLPLLLLFVIPALNALYGLLVTSIKSPIQFQQGTSEISPWRAAVQMVETTLPVFSLVCLLIRGPSVLLFPVGAIMALISTLCATASILHYIPSPSINMYIQLRFHSRTLRMMISFIQTMVCAVGALLLLAHSASFISSTSSFSPYLIIPLLACFAVFGIIFGGQTNTASPLFFLHIIVILAGSGIFVYSGLEELPSLQSLAMAPFAPLPAVASLSLGFVLTLYLLSASPFLFQSFFSLPTRHRVRLCLIFYGVFLLLASFVVYFSSTLFVHFLEKYCPLTYSFSSLLQFIRYTVPQSPWLPYFVVASFLMIPLSALQLILVSSVSHLWEDFARTRLQRFSQIRQLCVLQAVVFILGLALMLAATALHIFHIELFRWTPIVFFSTCSVAAMLTAVFIAGYYFPCANSKGGIGSIVLSSLVLAALLYFFVKQNSLPVISNSCFAEEQLASIAALAPLPSSASIIVTNSTVTASPIRGFAVFVGRIPLALHPIFIFMLTLLLCALISACSGGQDLFVVDWNLVVFPCAALSASLRFPSNASSFQKRRPFVESESFRYAQQTALPDCNGRPNRPRPPPIV